MLHRKVENKKKLISITSYLLNKGYRPEHFPAMIEFAKPKKVATKEEWDMVFSSY